MPRATLLLIAAGALLSADLAAAQEAEVLYDSEGYAWVTDLSPRGPRHGPGFRRFVRGMIGGAYEDSARSYGFEMASPTDSFTGFGSVHVNFVVPGGPNGDFLRGWRDYGTSAEVDVDDDTGGAPIQEVDSGPGTPFSGDGVVDNIDGDLGSVIGIDLDGDGGSDAFFYDFDDLHQFNIRFSDLSVAEWRSLASLELMAQHLLTRDGEVLTTQPAWRLTYLGVGPLIDFGSLPVADVAGPTPVPKGAGWFGGFRTVKYLAYGVRYNRGKDIFAWGGNIDGAFGLGESFATTRSDHRAIGSQLTVGRVVSRGRWMFDLSAMAMLGYQETKTVLSGGYAENLLPGGLNRPASVRPHYSSQESDKDDFARHVEVRLTTSYFFNRNWSADAMVRGFIGGPWYTGVQQFAWTAPNYTLRPTGGDQYYGGNVYLGVTYVR